MAMDKAKLHRRTKIAVQIVFFVLAPGLFAAAFSGVKYIFSNIGVAQPFEAVSFLVVLALLLVFTIVFGRFFCGYACAFGALGDWIHAIYEAARKRLGIPEVKFSQRTVRVLSLLKYVILVAICAACFFGGWSLVSGMSPWVAFSGLTTLSFTGISIIAWILLGCLIVLMAVRERAFCQFFCPMGAIFALMPSLSTFKFKRTPSHCARSCGRCSKSCPVSIWPDADAHGHGECIACGKCADVCPLLNVNIYASERALAPAEASAPNMPVRKTKETWRMVKGNETALVLAKAALLLAFCWAIGSVRFF